MMTKVIHKEEIAQAFGLSATNFLSDTSFGKFVQKLKDIYQVKEC